MSVLILTASGLSLRAIGTALEAHPDTRSLPAGALDPDAALSALGTLEDPTMPSRPDPYSAVRLPAGLVDPADRPHRLPL